MTALLMVTNSTIMGLTWVHTWLLSHLRGTLHLNFLTLCYSILILARRDQEELGPCIHLTSYLRGSV